MRGDRWALSMLAREANRNVFSAGSRLFPLVAIAVLLGSTQASFVLHQEDQLRSDLAEAQLLGRNVVVVQPLSQSSPGTVSRESCESLSQYSQVERSGIVGDGYRDDFVELGPQVAVQQVSSTLVPELQSHNSVVGDSLWHGFGELTTLRSQSGQVFGSVEATAQPLGLPLDSSIAVPLSVDVSSGDYCVAILSPYIPLDQALILVASELRISGSSMIASTPYDSRVDPLGHYLARPERLLPALTGVLVFSSALVLSRFRSSEFAAYRLSGTSRRSLALLIVFEQYLLAGCYFGAAFMVTASFGFSSSGHNALMWAFVGALGWTVSGAAASSFVLLRSAADLAKDR